MKKSIFIVLCLIGVTVLGWCFISHRKQAVVEDVIIVGTNAEYPPFSFVENDEIVGFDIDLIKEVCNRLNKKIELRDMPFDVLIPEVQRGSIQVISAGITPTPEREKELLFTKCYFSDDPLVIVAPVDKPLTTIDQLTGKNVIVNDGYTADFYMSAIQGPKLKRLPAPAAAFLALESGRADAYVVARSTVVPFFKQYGTKNFSVTPIKDTEEKYALAVSPHNAHLLHRLNAILDEMQEDGKIQKLKKKWSLE